MKFNFTRNECSVTYLVLGNVLKAAKDYDPEIRAAIKSVKGKFGDGAGEVSLNKKDKGLLMAILVPVVAGELPKYEEQIKTLRKVLEKVQ